MSDGRDGDAGAGGRGPGCHRRRDHRRCRRGDPRRRARRRTRRRNGAVVGAGTGAAIASEGERRRSGYYAYQRGCYMQRPDGYYVRVSQRYCY
ncbi:hypothetical protein M2191_006396 [Bradyrhizobium japonicum]|nr:hypothetical protein [Bradyrhizobium japonicum]